MATVTMPSARMSAMDDLWESFEMSDGQTQACESIQQQSRATCCRVDVSQESYTWQDSDGGWHVGRKVWKMFPLTWAIQWLMVDSTGQHWHVSESLLCYYGPRCEACGGDQVVDKFVWDQWRCVGNKKVPCPACGGSGRRP